MARGRAAVGGFRLAPRGSVRASGGGSARASGAGPDADTDRDGGADDDAEGAVPDDVMAPTASDAVAVLLVWVARRAFYPMLLLGLAFAWIAGEEVSPVVLVRLENPLQLIGALFTPLAGIAVALAARVLTDLVALAVAFPRTRWASEVQEGEVGVRRGPVRRWVDRFYLTAAYRELRSTWTVRGRAADQLGRSGPWLTGLNVTMWLVTVAAAVVLVWSVVATPEVPWVGQGG